MNQANSTVEENKMEESRAARLVAYVPTELHQWVKSKATKENRTVSNLVETVLVQLRQSAS
jgi:hypothetical protein